MALIQEEVGDLQALYFFTTPRTTDSEETASLLPSSSMNTGRGIGFSRVPKGARVGNAGFGRLTFSMRVLVGMSSWLSLLLAALDFFFFCGPGEVARLRFDGSSTGFAGSG